MMNVCVVCVKWGEKFPSDYVNRLYNMVRRNTTIGHRFVCLTDNPSGLNPSIETKDLVYDFQYCWTKMELFRPDLFTRSDLCLYLDLDVVITDNIDELITIHPEKTFIGLFDWYSTRRNPHYNSSVLRFHGAVHSNLITLLQEKIQNGSLLWDREYDKYLNSNNKVVLWEDSTRYGSDQEWISHQIFPPGELKKNSFPKKWIQSYKKHGKKKLPRGCRVMIFHGYPKPHETNNNYVKIHWK